MIKLLSKISKEKIKNIKIAVFGDLMIDNYILGSCERLSPEAPVPILNVKDRFYVLGGAGNVCVNINGLGASVVPIGFIGEDESGKIIEKLFNNLKISSEHVYSSSNIYTTSKTRLLSGNQQLIRYDDEKIDYDPILEEKIEKRLLKILHNIDMLVISDYGKNTCSDQLTKKMIDKSRELHIPIIVDPEKDLTDFKKYRNSTIIKPNFNEVKNLYGQLSNNDNDIENVLKKISKDFNIENVIITRGSKGMSILSNENKIVHINTSAKEIYDVSGAGDTVLATVSVLMNTNFNIFEASEVANYAAGIVISKMGTRPIEISELVKDL